MSRAQPDPAIAEDDGAPDAALAQVLSSYQAGESNDADVLAALTRTRLIVPVTALPAETGTDNDGLVHEKTVEMALPVMIGTDGRRALPAFTSVDALAAWDPAARPVPVPAHRAAEGAMQENCAFLVVDPAGPVTWVADRVQLELLACGRPQPTA